jgi:2',3'-cyclic-nucleotide 2'-phosphodiesterase (5'-nucleotidase family)
MITMYTTVNEEGEEVILNNQKSGLITVVKIIVLVFSLLIVATLSVTTIVFGYLAFRTKQEQRLDNKNMIELITFNDVYQLHQVLTIEGDTRGGASRVSQYIKTLKSKRLYPENILVISGGDTISPSRLSTLFNGAQMINASNLMGLNYSALGNHEFDFGVKVLESRINESQFVWLNSNVQLPFPTVENVVIQVGPVKLGLFGILFAFGPSDKSVVIKDMIETSKEQVIKLKQKGAQYIIALTHQSAAEDCKLSTTVPDINLIVGGHEHRMQANTDCGQAPFIKATQDWQNIWHVKIDFTYKTPLIEFDNIAITKEMPTDPAMENLIAYYESNSGKEFKQVIGRTLVNLDGREYMLRTSETNLGDYIADKYREYTGTNIALFNGGGIRGNMFILAGSNITKGNVFDMFPFLNSLIMVNITGDILRQAIENGLSGVDRVAGRFPVISGFNITYTLNNPIGYRVLGMQIKSGDTYVDIDPNMELSLTTSSYLYQGGDGYSMLTELTPLIDPESAPTMVVVMIDSIEKDSVLSPLVDGRLRKI